MPSTRHIATEQPGPTATFSFPHNAHLLVTTPSTIYAWDVAGLHAIFTSSKNGIVAAREAKDGSGMLAVADKHVVILHDTKRGQEQSWGLHGDEDEVRHLEYAQDTKWLYLSTSLTHDVQKYSIERSRLMGSTQSHPSAPIALAISPTGHWMVSASDMPPVVSLKSLQHNTQPMLIEPRASSAAVCTAAFHPERPNIFLLGFRDGTVAAYDATRVSRKNRGSFSNQETVNDGEISHFTSLHRTTSKTVASGGIASKNASIAGAAFLQGYKSRAITVGSDGRCRLVDFADRGIILRSWHAKAPLTSVSVLSIRNTAVNTARSKRSTSDAESFTIGGPTSTNNLIAVGRTDGRVHLYDSVGLLLEQKTVNEVGEKILGVGWVKGPSPSPIAAKLGARDASYGSPTLAASKVNPSQELGPATAVPVVRPKSSRRRCSTPERPADLRRAARVLAQLPSARSDRRFTVHPDEAEADEEGTVRYTPAPHNGAVAPLSTGNILDLFSPVKSVEPQNPGPSQKRLTSPRPRPRISSQTFSSPADDALGQSGSNVLDLNNPAASAATTDHQKSALKSVTSAPLPRASTQISQLNQRHISFKPVQRGSLEKAYARGTAAMPPNENAKVLADLRKMSDSLSMIQGGVLAPFASSKTSTSATDQPAKPLPVIHDEEPAHTAKSNHHWFGHGKGKKRPRMGLGKQKYWHPGNVLERESTWPTDSMLEDSLDADDIWITDASENGEDLNRRRRTPPLLDRAPGRQSSRSRGVMRTANTMPPPPSSTAKPEHFDGSATENFETAQSHVSPDGTFSPGSEDIRQLFPRASSLSPQRKKTPGGGTRRSPRSTRVLQEIAENSLARTKSEAKSPWSKARAVKTQKYDAEMQKLSSTAADPNVQCRNCVANSSRISVLEDELARLKGEVLVLKTAMRRAGVSLPASMRAVR
ncbi:WD40 repeat protein [Teratosphaeria destructans]|uniref:WD40 repeat protein n=1 Tax=Teratosphaeria destructans TaxID=418781 RepID=A0A9W7W1Y5_9PEZI|nr:WD40 repeat protein [Teratosphaeria destructans]